MPKTENHRRKQRIYIPGHPLADRTGAVKYSRWVLYEKLDGQDAPCHFCRRPLVWITPIYGDRIVADHIDGNPLNSVPENLEPACRGCNANREDGTGYLTTEVERGTIRCYGRKCNHEECKQAWRDYQRQYRQANLERVRALERERARRARAR